MKFVFGSHMRKHPEPTLISIVSGKKLEVASKPTQPLPQTKTLSLLDGLVYKSALCYGERHFLCLPRLFVVQTSLKRLSRTKLVQDMQKYNGALSPQTDPQKL